MESPRVNEASIYDTGAGVLPLDVERSNRRGERSKVVTSGSHFRGNARDHRRHSQFSWRIVCDTRAMKRLSTGFATILLSMTSLVACADDASPLVPPSEKVGGLSQGDWSGKWWQWAASFAEHESPVADKTGRHCRAKQSGAVWFLAGTYGTQRTLRTCTVPAGKYLFFPLINYVVFPQSEHTLTCEEAKATAAAVTDDVSALVLDVDGKNFKKLSAHRQATGDCFDLDALGDGGITPSAANGYYIMLKPLSRGTHTLNFGGILPDMTQAVTYTLHVE
jgi:hypothetical protein